MIFTSTRINQWMDWIDSAGSYFLWRLPWDVGIKVLRSRGEGTEMAISSAIIDRSRSPKAYGWVISLFTSMSNKITLDGSRVWLNTSGIYYNVMSTRNNSVISRDSAVIVGNTVCSWIRDLRIPLTRITSEKWIWKFEDDFLNKILSCINYDCYCFDYYKIRSAWYKLTCFWLLNRNV